MGFEFDADKSEINKVKHKIDFEEAQELWNGPIVQLKSKDPQEDRLLVVGLIENKSWTAIITMRRDVIRIISVRRSRENEKAIYKKQFDH